MFQIPVVSSTYTCVREKAPAWEEPHHRKSGHSPAVRGPSRPTRCAQLPFALRVEQELTFKSCVVWQTVPPNPSPCTCTAEPDAMPLPKMYRATPVAWRVPFQLRDFLPVRYSGRSKHAEAYNLVCGQEQQGHEKA
jgi:hypothetical protein